MSTLKDRALAAAKEAEAQRKQAERTRKREQEKRAREEAEKALRHALQIGDDVEGSIRLRNADGTGFVTEYDGLEFQLIPDPKRTDGAYAVYVVFEGDEGEPSEKRRVKTLAGLGKILAAEAGR